MERSLGRRFFVEEVLRQKAKELNKKGFSIVSANDVRALDVFHGALDHGILLATCWWERNSQHVWEKKTR